MSDKTSLPLPRQQEVILMEGRKRKRRTSVPLDRLHVSDAHAKAMINAIRDCTNTAKPGMVQMARVFLGDELLQQEGLL